MTPDEWDRHLFGDEPPARAEDPGLRWTEVGRHLTLRDRTGGTLAVVVLDPRRGKSPNTATVRVMTGGVETFHRTGMTFDRVLRFFETLTDPPPPPPPVEAGP
jgi:hypothetical protein